MLLACPHPSILTVLRKIALCLLVGLDVVIMDYRYGILEVLWGSIVVRLFCCGENSPGCILGSGDSTQFPQALLNFGQCDECQPDAERV